LLAEIPSVGTVGFALFFNQYSTATGRGMYLHDLYVSPEARSIGLGFALLRGVAKAARGRHCNHLRWLAFDWNEKAIRLYKSERVGACETGTTTSTNGSGDSSTFVNFVLNFDGIANLAASSYLD
jgi:GNAT superfamily N-acetyltransferase